MYYIEILCCDKCKELGDRTTFLIPARTILKTWEMINPTREFRITYKEEKKKAL